MDTESSTSIKEFYADQTIFITGGTGFIGKVLVEKLLRSCHRLKRIYLAMRPKKGVDINQRWEEICKVPLFDKLKKERPEALKKVYIISADLKKPDLGLSDEDKQTLINEVNIIFHVAATVQFVDSVMHTITQNTRSTYLLCELAKLMKNLKVFSYTSTAYSNFYRPESEWDEKLYPAVVNWKTILKLLETESNTLTLLQEKILMGHPNPYTYSKSLAEEIVDNYKKDFKAVIVRPSVVMPSCNDPVIGWVDNLNGMAALCIANALGILRVAWSNDEAYQDFAPVDIVVRSLIISAWAKYHGKDTSFQDETAVYNCSSGTLYTVRTSDICRWCTETKFVERTPSKLIVWTRNLRLIENSFWYHTMFYIHQLLPACVLDTAIYLYGEKPLFLKIAKKITFANTRLFKAFCFAKVHFENKRLLSLIKFIDKNEVDDFGVPEATGEAPLDLKLFLENMYLGVLKYMFKEDLSKENIEKNKKRYNRIKALDKGLQVFLYSSLGWITYRLVDPIPIIANIIDAVSI